MHTPFRKVKEKQEHIQHPCRQENDRFCDGSASGRGSLCGFCDRVDQNRREIEQDDGDKDADQLFLRGSDFVLIGSDQDLERADGNTHDGDGKKDVAESGPEFRDDLS